MFNFGNSDFVNLDPALLCSLGFFGLFMSVNSAMNTQT
jgi:MFS family permease